MRHSPSDNQSGAIFVTTVVLAVIVIASEFRIKPLPLFRDVLVLIASLGALFIILSLKKFYWWAAIGFFISYFVYIISIFVGRYFLNKYQTKKRETIGVIDDIGVCLIFFICYFCGVMIGQILGRRNGRNNSR